MEMYFEAIRFVSILLDFSKNKMYTFYGCFNKGHAPIHGYNKMYTIKCMGVLIRGMHAHDSWF
jgi:hypothetical protein